MDIAISKRKENIGEYILYLWQLEDLLRALQFSPEAIFSQLVQSRDLDDDRKQEIFFWYMEIANLLREEGKQTTGHLEHTLHLIADLQQLHIQLMQLPIGERYRKLYANLAPELPRMKTALGKPDMSDIELCFRALYAVMLYRIKGDDTKAQSIEDVLEVISPVIAELAHNFKKIETGQVDMFKE